MKIENKNQKKINSWIEWLKIEFNQTYFIKMKTQLNAEYQKKKCLPPRELVFRAFSLTPKEKIKVVILGQDPYHNLSQANGLSFGVNHNISLPMSLKNIFKEIKSNYPNTVFNTGDLTSWAKQGVFLLNSVLTVRLNQPLSHQNFGWEIFTDKVIQEINRLSQPIVFLLWGKKAQAKSKFLNNNKHQVFTTSHPSPFSVNYGFFGSQIFKKTNIFLTQNNLTPIDWGTKLV